MLRSLRRLFSHKEEVNNVLSKLQLKDSLNKLEVEDGLVSIQLKLNEDYRRNRAAIMNNVKALSWVKECKVSVAPAEKQTKPQGHLSKIKNIIAVASCKGGVGKSTIAVNLGFGISKLGYSVGIFDADIYGPSLPTLLKTEQTYLESPQEDPKSIIPIEYQGVKCMSYGWASQNTKAIFRGPIVSSLTQQLLLNTMWGELDYLILDTPPGTGDIQLTLCQELPISSAVIVTTPQKLSFVDVVKGIEMFDQLKVPTVAVVENMGYFECSNCSEKHKPFGIGYLDMLKKQFGIKHSYELPINPDLAKYSDLGAPVVLVHPENSQLVQKFSKLSEAVVQETQAAKSKKHPEVSYAPKEAKVVIETEEKTLSISPYDLRVSCQCAACVEEFSGKKILNEKEVPGDVYPLRIEPKGNYAVAIVWSDGHRSSIYPYQQILNLVKN